MSTDIVKAEQPKPPIVIKGGKPIIESVDQAYRMAQIMVKAGWAGKHTVESATVATMQGATLGLTPFQSVQHIAVINGRPTLWGDGAIAVVWSSGECVGCDVEMCGKGDERYALATVARKGVSKPVQRTFSVADAKKAGLWGKAGPWSNYPERMLLNRARAFAIRDLFADKLQGISIREEIDDYSEPVKVENTAEPKADPLGDVPIDKHEDDAEFVAGVLGVMNGGKQ